MKATRVAWWLLALGLLVAVWWLWPRQQPLPVSAAPGSAPEMATAAACALPMPVAHGAPPLQGPLPVGASQVALDDARLLPVAGFSIEARVLGRADYRLGREARYSPTDLALGWGRMRDAAVLAQLDIRQSGRWYHYRWSGLPPLPPPEIVASSANMHMIPADAGIAEALGRVRRDQSVRIDGWLVDVQARDGWRWRSSTRRDDTGQGACEIVYVCAVTLLDPARGSGQATPVPRSPQ